MRILLMFDVPAKTKKDRKYATKFRNELINLGYFMIQYSVYMRICKGASSAKASINSVRRILPPRGNVRTIIITEKQFDNMEILLGNPSYNESVNDDKSVALFSFDEKTGDYIYGDEDDTDDKSTITYPTKDIKSKDIKSNIKPKEKTLFDF